MSSEASCQRQIRRGEKSRSAGRSKTCGGKKLVHLIFPKNQIKKPVIYTMAKKYNVVPNIRRANVTEKIGEVTLQLSGSEENLGKAEKYLGKLGVKVEPLIGDILE